MATQKAFKEFLRAQGVTGRRLEDFYNRGLKYEDDLSDSDLLLIYEKVQAEKEYGLEIATGEDVIKLKVDRSKGRA